MDLDTNWGVLSVLRPVNCRDALYIQLDPEQIGVFVHIVQSMGFNKDDFVPAAKTESTCDDDVTAAPSQASASHVEKGEPSEGTDGAEHGASTTPSGAPGTI